MYSLILCSNTFVEVQILLSLNAWLYEMLCFKCGGCNIYVIYVFTPLTLNIKDQEGEM